VVILEGPDPTWFTGVETTATPDSGRLHVVAGLSLLDETIWVNRSQVRMTVLAGGFAADIRVNTLDGRIQDIYLVRQAKLDHLVGNVRILPASLKPAQCEANGNKRQGKQNQFGSGNPEMKL
jgi:hypothetical protein